MQHRHSCSTLKSRVKIFGCRVQELYINFYPLDHYPLLHRACVHIKGVWSFQNSVETKAPPTQFSKLIFPAVSRRYDSSKWPHESLLFRLYLQEK